MPAARCACPLSWAPRAVAALFIGVVCFVVSAAAQTGPTFPALTSRITDQAGLLSADDYTAIMAELAALEQKSTDQFAVVTVKSLEGYPIEDYGYRLGRKWGIGQKGKDNGILLIVAPNERKVRIEVGRGLEPVMTDAMSSLIIRNAILPEFRRGDFSAGIRAGVRDIKDVLLGDAEEVKERARQASDALDFWQIVVDHLLDLRRAVRAVRRRAIDQSGAASGRRPPRAACRAGRRTRKLRRMGRRLVGRRWRRRRMVRAVAAISAAAARREAGDGDEAASHETVLGRRRAAHLRGDRQCRTADVGRDRRRRRRTERRLPLRAAAGGGDRQPARALGADLFHRARSRVDLPHPARRVRRGDGGADAAHHPYGAGSQGRSSGCTRTAAPSSSSWCRTCTRPLGAPACLLFVSVAERYAEIIADEGINERVAPGTWKDIVDGLTAAIGSGHPADGFVTAIAAIGAILAKHFPPGTRSPNELPDHLIILQ